MTTPRVTFFMRMHADVASAELSPATFRRHALLLLCFPLLLLLVPPISKWSGIEPLPCLLVLSAHLLAYGSGAFFGLYDRHPIAYSTFVSTVNAATCAAIVALPGKFIAPVWVLYFSYPFVAARAAPISIMFAIQFSAQPLFVGLAWDALGLVPFEETASALGAVSLFAGILYLFLAHTTGVQREGLLKAAEARAEEQERQRIAGELHDTLGAALAEITLWQSIAMKRSDDEGRRALVRVDKRARAASVELRSLVRGLKSGVIDVSEARALLESRLNGLCEAASVSLTVTDSGSGGIAVERAHHLVKIAEEAVTNAIRHGPPRAIHVDADWTSPRLRIVDDGPGFDANTITPGVGLSSMRKRAAALGSSLTIDSTPGSGTRIALS